jgi:hypothetical protein
MHFIDPGLKARIVIAWAEASSASAGPGADISISFKACKAETSLMNKDLLVR